MGRGVYNEAFDVFIDTTNIIVVENEFNHSITFQIVDKENEKVIENLILNSKPEGGYKAFIAKYDLSSEELLTLLDDEKLLTKKPTTITEVNNYSRIDVGGDGADCIDIEIGTRSVCRNAHGNIIANNGELGNDCVGMPFQQEYLVLTIDAGCLSGGGGGSSPGSGSGSSPGSGTGNSGGGGSGSTGGNPGNPGNPNTGNPPNDGGNNNTPGQQDPSLTDGNGNPIITTPILTVNRTLIKLLNQLDPQQKDWWENDASSETKNEIINFINQNSTVAMNGVIDAEILAFIQWSIDYLITNPSVTIEQFQNWFMTPREGKDWDYDAGFWENPNLSFEQQDLPSWDDFEDVFPTSSGSQLVETVGGQVKQAYDQYPSLSRGYCALKVSRALNYSGITIPQITTTAGKPGTVQGSDGKYYFLNAKALNAWMRETFGTNPQNSNHHHFTSQQGGTNGENFPTLVAGLKGIYSMVSTDSNWASGHADIIENQICLSGCHLSDTPPAPIDYIDIWVLE